MGVALQTAIFNMAVRNILILSMLCAFASCAPVSEPVIEPEVLPALLGEGGAGIQDVSPPLLGAGGAGIRNCSAFTVEAWMLQLAAPLQVDPVYQALNETEEVEPTELPEYEGTEGPEAADAEAADAELAEAEAAEVEVEEPTEEEPVARRRRSVVESDESSEEDDTLRRFTRDTSEENSEEDGGEHEHTHGEVNGHAHHGEGHGHGHGLEGSHNEHGHGYGSEHHEDQEHEPMQPKFVISNPESAHPDYKQEPLHLYTVELENNHASSMKFFVEIDHDPEMPVAPECAQLPGFVKESLVHAAHPPVEFMDKPELQFIATAHVHEPAEHSNASVDHHNHAMVVGHEIIMKNGHNENQTDQGQHYHIHLAMAPHGHGKHAHV